MSSAQETNSCLEVWSQADRNTRAETLDTKFPECACERHSFCPEVGGPIGNGETLARIFTSPASYDLESNEIVRGKIVSVHSSGLSIIRQSASDEEIALTVRELTEGTSEPQMLVGASFFRAAQVRYLTNPDRWFCIYHTPASQKTHHADLLGTMPNAQSNNQKLKELSRRRRALVDFLFEHMVPVKSVAELIERFRRLSQANC